jgi:PLP dependent protein
MVTAYDSGEVSPQAGMADRLADVRARIAAAARQAGRDPAEVRLLAISKFQPVTAIRAAVAAGQTDFGENRAQELVAKLDQAPAGVRWHFVGQLQRNKVKQVVGRVELIHSVDRMPLAEAIAAHAARRDLRQRVLVQVDVAGEPQKGGCAPDDVPALLDRIGRLDGIAAVGLMAIPPADADSAVMFERLRALRARHMPTFPDLMELSMGMSADIEVAVTHGATIVRVGTAIFGPRPRNR